MSRAYKERESDKEKFIRLQNFELFQKQTTLKSNKKDVKYSELWKEFRSDFGYSFNHAKEKIFLIERRSYGVNNVVGDLRLFLFIKLHKIIYQFSSLINKIIFKVFRLITKIIQIIYFGTAKNRFFISIPFDPTQKLMPKGSNLEKRYHKKFSALKWFYSHNSFKSFYYYDLFCKHIKKGSLQGKNLLEIGSGVCNFAMILTEDLQSFNYFCLDIPEMIPAGFLSVNKFSNRDDIEIFLPHEIEDSIISKSPKKITFITPNQLEKISCGIDLLVNHESFAEMNIETVNSYLKRVKTIANPGMIFFLVNRLQRQTNLKKGKLESITIFNDYDLEGVNTLYKELDAHRQAFIGVNSSENIFYIGRM